MRILFLAQLLPWPLDAGPKIRAYYVLRHLAAAGHEITLVCFVRPSDSESDVRCLGHICRSVETVPLRRSRWQDLCDGVRSLGSDKPFLILRDQVRSMDERVQQIADGRSFDAVHADQLWMAPYGARCLSGPLKVLDQHNAVFRVPERLAANAGNPILRALLRREAGEARLLGGDPWRDSVALHRRKAEEELRGLSLVDELTGLYNRRGFLTLAEQQLKIANRMQRSMLLLFADLDYAKALVFKLATDENSHSLKERSYLKYGFLEAVDRSMVDTCGWMEMDNGFFFFTDPKMFQDTLVLFGMAEAPGLEQKNTSRP